MTGDIDSANRRAGQEASAPEALAHEDDGADDGERAVDGHGEQGEGQRREHGVAGSRLKEVAHDRAYPVAKTATVKAMSGTTTRSPT